MHTAEILAKASAISERREDDETERYAAFISGAGGYVLATVS